MIAVGVLMIIFAYHWNKCGAIYSLLSPHTPEETPFIDFVINQRMLILQVLIHH